MGRKFLLTILTLSSLFLIVHARADGSSPGTEPGLAIRRIRARALLQSIADPPKEAAVGDGEGRESPAEAPTVLEGGEMGRRHSADKSVAGGGVIIGGLVTAIFAVVYCYIRVTRKKAAANMG